MDLVITPAARGWRVIDAHGELPPSSYTTIEQAERDARNYLAAHGGGRITVREGAVTVWQEHVEGEGEASPSALRPVDSPPINGT